MGESTGLTTTVVGTESLASSTAIASSVEMMRERGVMEAHGHRQQGWETEANVCLLLWLDPRECSTGQGRWIAHASRWRSTHQAKRMQADVGMIPCLQPQAVWDLVHDLQEGHWGSTHWNHLSHYSCSSVCLCLCLHLTGTYARDQCSLSLSLNPIGCNSGPG